MIFILIIIIIIVIIIIMTIFPCFPFQLMRLSKSTSHIGSDNHSCWFTFPILPALNPNMLWLRSHQVVDNPTWNISSCPHMWKHSESKTNYILIDAGVLSYFFASASWLLKISMSSPKSMNIIPTFSTPQNHTDLLPPGSRAITTTTQRRRLAKMKKDGTGWCP